MCVCVWSTFSNISFETTGLIEAKFNVKPPWDGGMKICSNGPGHHNAKKRSSDFALYFEDSMIMSQHDQTFDLKINIGHGDLYFMDQWFCLISWRLFDIKHHTLGLWVSMTPDVWPKNKCRSLWSVFHGPVILPYILNTSVAGHPL